jgi:3-oxoadipate enol-lactonase
MRIKIGDIHIHYELSGNENGPVVMMSHSLGSSSIMWEPQLAALETRYRLLRFDTRGHGQSDAPEGAYTLAQLAGDAVALLDKLGIDRVHFVGLSMGGMIAQHLALSHPERLISLALCDTAAVIPDEAQPVWQERIDATRRHGMAAGVDETMQRWFTGAFLSKSPPAVEKIRTQFLDTPAEGFIGCSEAIRRLNVIDQLPSIRLPVLIIVGEDDPGTPVSAAEQMHARIPSSELVIIPSAAHLSNIEQADAFNRALLSFLDRQ